MESHQQGYTSPQRRLGSKPDEIRFTTLSEQLHPNETLLSSSQPRYMSVHGQDLKSRHGLTGNRLETMQKTPMISSSYKQSFSNGNGDSILFNPTAYSISSDHPSYAGNLSSSFKRSKKPWDSLEMKWHLFQVKLNHLIKQTWFIRCLAAALILFTFTVPLLTWTTSNEQQDSIVGHAESVKDPLVESYLKDTVEKQDVPVYYASSYQVTSHQDETIESAPFKENMDQGRYLLYNPHNDFEFQINSLENALMLASLMNCTLVAPYFKFSLNSIPATKILWKPFEDLHKESRVTERNCTLGTAKKANCVRMEDIFDFSWMKKMSRPISIIDVETFMQRIQVQGYNNEQVSTDAIWNQVAEKTTLVLVEDVHRLSYRFYDSQTEKPNPSLQHLKEDDHFDLIDIQAFHSNITLNQFVRNQAHQLRHTKILVQNRDLSIPKPLVFHFGSLYGRSKLHLATEKVHAKESLHSLIMGSNRQLHDMADKITAEMGGVGSFVSLHLDLGTEFVSHIRVSVEQTIECLKDRKCVFPDQYSLRPLRTEKMSSHILECVENHRDQNAFPIFISVDLHGDPRNYPYLRPLVNAFPCIFSIHDFRREFVGALNISSSVIEDIALQHFMPIVSELVNSNGHHLNRLYELSKHTEDLHSRFESASKKIEQFRRKWVQEHSAPPPETPVVESANDFVQETDRCYVHYASHSGFNVQRTELENGIMMAYLLNCSLVVPFAQIGKTLSWNEYDSLVKEAHELERKCVYMSAQELQQEQHICSTFSTLFDLKAIAKQFPTVRFLDSKEFSQEIDSKLNQAHDAYWEEIQQKNNIVSIKAQQKISFLMYDSDTFAVDTHSTNMAFAQNQRQIHALDRKKEVFDVLDIQDLRKPVVLQDKYKSLKHTTVEYHPVKRNLPAYATIYRFGSLEGEKVALSLFQRDLRQHVHSSMIFRNPVLLSVARDVIHRLGGAGSFISLHLRTGDEFAKEIHQTVRLMIQSLRACISHQDCDVKKEGELGVVSDPNTVLTKTLLHEKSARLCQRLDKETGSKDVFTIFLATDMSLQEMKQNPMVAAFLREYPCVYILSQFNQEMKSFTGPHPDHPDNEPCDNAFFIPLIEQIIASQAHFFIGTPGSSFSSFIHRLHDEYFEQVYTLIQEAKPQ